MTKKLIKGKYIEQLPNGLWADFNHHIDDEPEYIEEENRLYYAKEETFIPEILADGYVEFPIMFSEFGEIIWSSCYLPPEFVPSCTEGFEERFGLRYNVYIPSYRRAHRCHTANLMARLGVKNYYICIDPSQYPEYKKHHERKHIVIRDPSFRSEKKMDMVASHRCPDYLHAASVIFNPLLFMSKSLGEQKYTNIDDDIFGLGMKAHKGDEPDREKYDRRNYYMCSNLEVLDSFDFVKYWNEVERLFDKVRNGSFMSIEKHGLVYTQPIKLKTGTRSYSFYLTDNRHVDYHIGQENSDTLTSLKMSQQGYVNTVVNGAVSYSSEDTQQGGGSTEVYQRFGTLTKTEAAVRSCPDKSKIAPVYSRIHHLIDYNPYKEMRLLGKAKEQE